ncbi:MAG: TadE/TadG family type IV pilus assembly protein [Rhizomicrobium sp.]
MTQLSRTDGRRRFYGANEGSAAIEFALIMPVLALFMFGLIEVGAIYYFNSTLTNAANDAARMVRTGQVQTGDMTKTQYIARVCSEMAMVDAVTCAANLQVDMESFDSFTDANYTNLVNPDGSLDTAAMQFETGGACDTVLVRAFYPWSIMTPFMKLLLGNMPNGQYLMTSATAFRNEPFVVGSSC